MQSGSSSDIQTDNSESVPDILEWSVHPSSRHPIKSALTIMLIAMVGGAVFQVTGVVFYSFLAVIILLVTAAPFFLRTVYRLDETGVTAKRFGRTRKLAWSQICSVTKNRDTVYVSSYSSKSIRQRNGILLLKPGNTDSLYRYILKQKNKRFQR